MCTLFSPGKKMDKVKIEMEIETLLSMDEKFNTFIKMGPLLSMDKKLGLQLKLKHCCPWMKSKTLYKNGTTFVHG